MNQKNCNLCNLLLPETSFYKGRLQCKECYKSKNKNKTEILSEMSELSEISEVDKNKNCNLCNRFLPETSFYKGRLQCKECYKHKKLLNKNKIRESSHENKNIFDFTSLINRHLEDLKDKDTEINILKNEIHSLNKKIYENDNKIYEKDNDIFKLKTEIHFLNIKVHDKDNEINIKDNEIHLLKIDNINLNKKTNKLELELDEIINKDEYYNNID